MEAEKIDQKKFGKLKWAIFHGRRGLVEPLLENETPVDNPCSSIEDFRSPLHSSIYLGDAEIVKKLLDRGASVNVLNENNETALMLAAKFEKYDIVDLLLSDKRLENCVNREHFTHLHIACMRNRVDVVEKLLEHKAGVNLAVKSDAIRWSGYTSLHFAVEFKSIETIAFLLKVGADITIQDSKKLTALHLADMKRNDQIIDMILEAHKRVTGNPVNSEGLSHFHIACTRNNREIVECFIRNGVTLNSTVHKESWNWPKFTPIDFAIYYDCIDIVRLLLLEGGRKTFPSKDGINRVRNSYYTGNAELVDLILQRDNLTKLISNRYHDELPELHYAVIYEKLEDVQDSLSERPSDLNLTTWKGDTPLHLAVERGSEKIIQYLLEQGADYSIKNAGGKSPLHLAFERNRKKTVNSFLKKLDGINQNSADNDEISHFHIACIENDVEAVGKFIKFGVDVNAAVNFDSVIWPGYTPLHLAAKFGSLDVVQMLLDHEASYVVLDKNSKSAFDIAISELLDIDQENAKDMMNIMKAILLTHSRHQIESFNDRGFSLLHLLSTYPYYDVKGIIEQHRNDIDKVVQITGTPWDGYTPLHFAMLEEEPDNADFLCKMGADISIKAADGNYPFHLAVDRYVTPRVPLTTSDFEKMQHNPVGSNGFSMFHVACAAGDLEWMKYFLEHGVDLNVQTTLDGHEFHDKTPFHLIVVSLGGSKLEAVKLLLDHGADIGQRDYYLNTPLHLVIRNFYSGIIDLLISYGVDVNSRNASLETPLLTICRNNIWYEDYVVSEKIVRMLDNGADINLADEVATTALTIDTWRSSAREFPLSIEKLLKHVIKLKEVGLEISEDNDEAYSRLSLIAEVALNASYIYDYPGQCRKEIELMKEVYLNVYTSLYDVLLKDPNGLSVMSENDDFQRLVESDDFRKKYPIYGPMLEVQLRRGRKRKPLLANAKKVLKFLINVSLPQECTEQILRFLSDDDLENIIKSSSPP